MIKYIVLVLLRIILQISNLPREAGFLGGFFGVVGFFSFWRFSPHFIFKNKVKIAVEYVRTHLFGFFFARDIPVVRYYKCPHCDLRLRFDVNMHIFDH